MRIGDVDLKNVQERFENFSEDMTYNLIVRLRHNQNRTTQHSISYSRISLTDFAHKLRRLNSANPVGDAESIVAKHAQNSIKDKLPRLGRDKRNVTEESKRINLELSKVI